MMKKLAVILTLVGGLYYAFKNTKNVLTKHLTLSTKLNHKNSRTPCYSAREFLCFT